MQFYMLFKQAANGECCREILPGGKVDKSYNKIVHHIHNKSHSYEEYLNPT